MGLFSTKPSVGRDLVRSGAINPGQLRVAQREVERHGGALGDRLLELGFIDEDTLIEALADAFDMPVIAEDALSANLEVLGLLPEKLRDTRSFLPVNRVGKTVTVAVSNPADTEALESLAKLTGFKVRTIIAAPSALLAAHCRLDTLASLMDHQGEEDLAQFVPLFTTLKDYRFIKTIARGGFGRVFQFDQLSLRRPVAVKVLDQEWSPIAEVAARFQKEGEIIARLDHPNIVRVYEQGEYQGFRYIVMEFFEGQPTDEALKGKDLVSKLACLRSLASALSYAHSLGIIHRDIKPGNVLLNSMGQVKLLDFGVARVENAEDSNMTRPQLVLGTPQYMAPELHRGAMNASAQSDIYALGVMAYEVLTELSCRSGQLLHPTQTDPKIPKELGTAILECLQEDPARRPASCVILGDIIQNSLDQLIFGEEGPSRGETPAPKMAGGAAPAPVTPGPGPSRAASRPQPKKIKIKEIEARYDFQSILRKDNRCKTAMAHHKRLNRSVVIKLVRKKIQSSKMALIKATQSAHIGQIYGIGNKDGAIVMIREYLDGGSLAEKMKSDMPAEQVADVLLAVVEALREAKRQNLGHGHLQPDNILFGSDGSIKVVDFGVVTKVNEKFPHYRGSEGTGNLFGDRFSLAVLTYELISGEAYDSRKSFEDLCEELKPNRKVQPLLKYFLGRLAYVKQYQPAFSGYADMVEDLQRIRSRMQSQPKWIDRKKAAAASRVNSTSIISKTVSRLARMVTKR